MRNVSSPHIYIQSNPSLNSTYTCFKIDHNLIAIVLYDSGPGCSILILLESLDSSISVMNTILSQSFPCFVFFVDVFDVFEWEHWKRESPWKRKKKIILKNTRNEQNDSKYLPTSYRSPRPGENWRDKYAPHRESSTHCLTVEMLKTSFEIHLESRIHLWVRERETGPRTCPFWFTVSHCKTKLTL